MSKQTTLIGEPSGSNQFQIMCTTQSFVCTCSAVSGLSGSEGAQNKDQHRTYMCIRLGNTQVCVNWCAQRGVRLCERKYWSLGARERGCVYWDDFVPSAAAARDFDGYNSICIDEFLVAASLQGQSYILTRINYSST